jgi:TolB protein
MTTSTAAQDSSSFPLLPGQIAYIGLDQNVYTLDSGDGSKTALTQDGSVTHFYQWPTWSDDGRLAYFQTTRDTSHFSTEVFISPDGSQPGSAAYVGEGEIFNYAYWSPQNCASELGDCRDLAVLLSGTDGLFIQLIRDERDVFSDRRTETGAPFYFSWSPDGARMLWQRNNQRLDIFDTTANNITETLNVMPGVFRAPAWSPVDDRLLVAVMNEDADTSDLTIITAADQKVLARNLSGPASFVWSPNGDYVAYTDRQGPLWVVDSRTGGIIAQSGVSGVGAFFWSPDSQHIAYISLAPASDTFSAQSGFNTKVAAYQQESIELAWSVLDVQTGARRSFGAFSPTEEMLYMLIYFDQFVQSHRIWSPDSRYIIYTEATPDGGAVINLLDTIQSNAVPFALADGFIGVWSFQ